MPSIFPSSSAKVINNLAYHDCLPANTEEEQRLRVQHDVFHRTLGNILLHVPVDLTERNAAVLESGTGSGIWLLDLARIAPTNVELIGIDIQSKIFPSSLSIPRNMSFQVNSILELPEDWNNKFTLVHQRLLFTAFTQGEWTTALQNMHRVLKPGGWIQLFEAEKLSKAGPMFKQLQVLWKSILASRNINGIWPHGSKTWRKLVEDAGFVDIQVRFYDIPIGRWAGQDGEDMKENVLRIIQALRGPTVENAGFGVIQGGAEGYDKWTQGVIREVDGGAREPQTRWTMICARKPGL
ncbi:hypothetical protein NP233_g2343 [Leucocoprinus birnbaumii]|uniref:Methyltransferase domain-containing protein n=1 Tax=Leucocoprinus birnbaumii TaxID=56174 RepID=A0AAD5W0Y7_9AGAR|nr:hypothetical protein NP233_g2343 [Leucocoprinus birnbaumii]